MRISVWVIAATCLWLLACTKDESSLASNPERPHAELMRPLLLADKAMKLDECLIEGPTLDRCREKQAIQRGDVGRCFDMGSPHRALRCLYELRDTPSPPLPSRRQCESLDPSRLEVECMAIRAVGLGDNELCEDYDMWGRDHCLSIYAREAESSATCDMIKHAGTRGRCQVDMATKLGPGVCKDVLSALNAQCVIAAFKGPYLTDFLRLGERSQRQVARGAVDICITSSSDTRRRHCIRDLVSLTEDLSLCGTDDASSEDIQYCMSHTTAPLVCDELERGLTKDHCIVERLLAKRQRGPSQSSNQQSPLAHLSCGLVKDKHLRTRCKMLAR